MLPKMPENRIQVMPLPDDQLRPILWVQTIYLLHLGLVSHNQTPLWILNRKLQVVIVPGLQLGRNTSTHISNQRSRIFLAKPGRATIRGFGIKDDKQEPKIQTPVQADLCTTSYQNKRNSDLHGVTEKPQAISCQATLVSTSLSQFASSFLAHCCWRCWSQGAPPLCQSASWQRSHPVFPAEDSARDMLPFSPLSNLFLTVALWDGIALTAKTQRIPHCVETMRFAAGMTRAQEEVRGWKDDVHHWLGPSV